MKKTYTAPVAETVDFCPDAPLAKISMDFSDFFKKSIKDELALKEDGSNT